MSETQQGYGSLEQQLKALENSVHTITTDPAASHWLKRAVTELWERDVVDALNDLDVLRDLLEAKHQAHVLTLKRMVMSDNGTRH
ncbi:MULTISPECIES: hypothetical protein [Thiothrix]|jgi:hypothetical protein|uniref:Uncharacterized protein n=2 Tax=Thiothrix TaxID=1030 RepID=A0A8B0SVV8_9GAMM|nr:MULTISPECIES: hypothetical protein [Thiothrix]MBO0611348.1 hypothetical protein [Thiothrix fructosivorans]QTX13112.1 hypothetical protein J1836_020930 [Thiothrix fructosivorans]UJS26666.1 hypothetical protein L2Y54_21475 [Thiothrix winogradskyi]